MMTFRTMKIIADTKAEREIITDAMELIHDLADPELAEVVSEMESQRRPSSYEWTLSIHSVTHLALAIDMLRDLANELTPDDLKEDPEASGRKAQIPLLTVMFNALKSELASMGTSLTKAS